MINALLYAFMLHVVLSDGWCALITLDYRFIHQSGSTFRVTGRRRQVDDGEPGAVFWGEARTGFPGSGT